ncbi:MAG TPA: anti-sigma factor [Usitatibacter sp.]|jgi:anti-sigma factor RsiW|nr:anti-sigma factor [Usitatibacter sp.]
MKTERPDPFERETQMLRRAFDPIMTEPIPARMYLRNPGWHEYARAAALVIVGVALGLALPWLRPEPAAQATAVRAFAPALAERAARAYLVYSPEVRHPVEVDAKEQDHLVKWLSKRLDIGLRVPVLTDEGFELLGGRLLPGPDGPVAQFMYQDASGKRLTLYVSRRGKSETQTAFRFAQEGRVNVFYWVDRECGYALSGELDKGSLSRVANTVYHQLENE